MIECEFCGSWYEEAYCNCELCTICGSFIGVKGYCTDCEDKPLLEVDAQNGDIFAVIGAVTRRLRKHDSYKKADDFRRQALKCKSYGEVVALSLKYVGWV